MIALILALVAVTQASNAADLPGSFRGSAFASYANVTAGPVAAQLGRSAYQPCPCRGTNGQVLSNTVNTIQAGDSGQVMKASATVSTVFTDKTATTATVQNTSTVSGLTLFNGLITATAIKAVANVAATASAITGGATGSVFTNLKIAGNAIDANVAANTQVILPGLGKVTLKKVQRTGNFTSLGRIAVQMMTIDISQANSFGLPVGAQIVLASATAAFTRSQPAAVVSGQAYATFANSTAGPGIQNKVGKAALVTMGCEGTGGKTLTNNITSFAAGSVFTLGESVSTAFGGPQNGGTVAVTTSTIKNAVLLGGVIRVATMIAVAKETFKAGVRTRSTAGSGVVGLTVASIPLPGSVPPNTTVPVPGLGRVVVNEQIIPVTGGKTQVNAVHAFVTTANGLGLPVGTELIIGHAEASAARF